MICLEQFTCLSASNVICADAIQWTGSSFNESWWDINRLWSGLIRARGLRKLSCSQQSLYLGMCWMFIVTNRNFTSRTRLKKYKMVCIAASGISFAFTSVPQKYGQSSLANSYANSRFPTSIFVWLVFWYNNVGSFRVDVTTRDSQLQVALEPTIHEPRSRWLL